MTCIPIVFSFDGILVLIQEARATAQLDTALVSFQDAYRQGKLTPQETARLVEAGKAQRTKLTSTAEGKPKNVAKEALSKATYQSKGASSPNPSVMQGDEHQLYTAITALDAELPDAFGQLERLELWYTEKERSEYGKKWLVPAITKKLAEIGDAWAMKAEPR